MRSFEQPPNIISPEIELQNNLTKLREKIHAEMDEEIKKRLETNPNPTEEEVRAGAFNEWIEPQAREAVFEMLKKGYGTQSSGFYGEHNEFQAVDGYFTVDDESIKTLKEMDIHVLRGPELGLPQNKLITQIRFYPKEADLQKIKGQWDDIAITLPKKDGPPGICDRVEEFREEYAPNHPSLEQDRKTYFEKIRKEAGVEEE